MNDPHPAPYTGITGLPDVHATVRLVDLATLAALVPAPRRLMVGVLVSAETLEGRPAASRRYPLRAEARRILSCLSMSPRVFRVVHFAPDPGAPLDAQLARLCAALPFCDAVQVNAPDVDPAALARFRADTPDVELIVPVPPEVLADVPALRDRARRFEGLATRLLLDASMGRGIAFDVRATRAALDALEGLPFGLGVAGGLGPGSAGRLLALKHAVGADRYARLSLDAETRVRVPCAVAPEGLAQQDHYSPELARRWLVAASAVEASDVEEAS